MVLVTVKEAVGAKLTTFIAGVDVNDCKIVNKSICEAAENDLSSTYDIRFHRLELKIIGSIDDANELVELANPNRSAISDVVAGYGHEDNASFVFMTNIKRFGTLFDILDEDVRALAGGVRQLCTGEERYCAVGAVVCTNNLHRLPVILLHRSWHGRVSVVDFISWNEATTNDMRSTPVFSVSNDNYDVSSFSRLLFYLNNRVSREPYTRWNTIVCATSKKTAETSFLPFISLSFRGLTSTTKHCFIMAS